MLIDFDFSSQTRIHFGRNHTEALAAELSKYGSEVMLLYGGGSIKRTGLYDEIRAVLKAGDKNVYEVGGVMPNPTYDKMMEGVTLAREHPIDLILAVGGGSVIDCAKGISVSVYASGDPFSRYWIAKEPVTNRHIPVGTVLTMAGTGSEMNGGSVITHTGLKKKIGRVFTGYEPEFSILNPELTYTVPTYQMLSGVFDIMSHLMETYFSGTDDNVSDDLIEALLKSTMKNTWKALKNPRDYESRSNLMWIATLALNGLTECSKAGDWQVHGIEHQLGAFTDCAHGMGLAAISPAYYRRMMAYGLPKFVRFATEVFVVTADSKTETEIAAAGIAKLAAFIRETGMVSDLAKLGITSRAQLKAIADSVSLTNGAGYKDLTAAEIYDILTESYKSEA